MSQHTFYTFYNERPVKILMGWDKPLQTYYLVIEYADTENEYVWSNLDYPEKYPDYLDDLLLRLQSFDLFIPNQMISEIEQDRAGNVGNKEVTHILNHLWEYERIEISCIKTASAVIH